MTNSFDILNAEIGAPDDGVRELEIVDIYTEGIKFRKDDTKPMSPENGRVADKVFLKCKTTDGEREFKISEAWNDSQKVGKAVQGLWVQLGTDNRLIENSCLASLLKYHNVTKPMDLKGMKVTGYPDTKGYVVLTTYDIPEPEPETEYFAGK